MRNVGWRAFNAASAGVPVDQVDDLSSWLQCADHADAVLQTQRLSAEGALACDHGMDLGWYERECS